MGKLNIFEISFNNGSGVFYSGNIVQGYVTVELTEPMKMRGIRLKFEGKAYVHWSESNSNASGKNRGTTSRHFSATEKYFDQDVLLFGKLSGQGSDTKELPAGRHTYPFQFQLPQDLPSSFEADIGHVRYTVSGTIDKPWKFDHKTQRVFTIISIFDLNQQPNTMSRLQETKEKHKWWGGRKSEVTEATFHIDRSGYVPGEAVKLYAEITFKPSHTWVKSYVVLKMVTTFHATTKSRTIVTEVARGAHPRITNNGEDNWTGEELIIPPLPPSFLVGCKIIDIHYILQLNVEPSGPDLHLEVPLEIIIGTIPLRSVVDKHPPMPPPNYNCANMYALETTPTAPPAEMLYPLPPPSDLPNLPPPSYNECINVRL
ncbi:unnamed protein product [Lymnaea stagnalis]|uniref:Arrestin C-terminal-like domain-containing protein n=1 Tax=Lymnaea stagnalis TaxID=6523 RepID=A0AAV2IBA6_LYMST